MLLRNEPINPGATARKADSISSRLCHFLLSIIPLRKRRILLHWYVHVLLEPSATGHAKGRACLHCESLYCTPCYIRQHTKFCWVCCDSDTHGWEHCMGSELVKSSLYLINRTSLLVKGILFPLLH